MASKSQTFEIVLTANGSAVTEVMDELKQLAKGYAEELDKLTEKKKQGITLTKEEEKHAESLAKKIQGLNTAWERNAIELRKVDEIMKDLSQATGNEMGRALKTLSARFKRAKSDAVDDLIKIKEQMQEVRHEMSKREGVDALKKAKATLTELANTPLDKLKMGLDSIEKKLATMSEAEKQAADGLELLEGKSRYQAQIAVTQYGRAGIAPVSGMNRDQLQTEQQRLRAGYLATEGVQGYETISQEYLTRLQKVNQAMKELTETERKEAQEAKAIADLKKADNVTARINSQQRQKVSLQELIEAQKAYEAELRNMQGINLTAQEEQQADDLKAKLESVKQAMTDIAQIDIDKTFDGIQNGTANLEQMEDALKKLKEQSGKIEMGDTQGIKNNIIDIEQMQKAIDDLKAKMQGLDDIDFDNLDNVPVEKLEAKLKQLEAQEKKLVATDTSGAQKMAENKRKVQEAIQHTKNNTIDLKNAQDVAANTGKHNVLQLQAAYDTLKQHLMSLNTEETDAIEKTQKQMKTLQKAISTAKGELTGFAKLWNTALKNIGAYMGVFAAFGYAKRKIMEVAEGSVALSDSMAQVQKVTGLTKDEVDDLNKSFAKIDTRTTITQLNGLAFSAGKMGLGKYGLEGVEGFVKATNQLQVALGDDLGNSVEEAITPLAKLAENMGLIQKMGVEKSMVAIGSSINELSQTTTAAGRNIVDFTRRIQPTAQMLGLTVDQVLALGSASDSFGVSAEVSATAFTKFLSSYRTNTEAIEQALGIAKGTLDDFYNKGQTMEGLLLIFQRMHDIGDIRVLAPIFKELGSEGSRMFETFGAFSKNIDQLRDHVLTSELAFEEATSVTREYNLVQDTAAGILERANNIWEKAFVNPEGVDMVKQLTIEWYNLSKELTNSATWIDFVQGLMKSMVFVVETLIKLLPTLVRAMFFYGVAQAIRKIYVQFTMLNTAMATATTTAGKLSAFLKSNLWVLAGTAIFFAVSAIYDMATASSKAGKEADAMGDALKKASEDGEKASAKERAELKRLYEATQDQTKAIEERTKAALELKRKYPDYFADLTTEQILAGKAADAYQNLAQQILNAAKARAMEKKIEKLEEENINLEDDNRKREQWRDDNQKKYEEEKAKIDRAVDQQNRMETAGASPVGGKWGYVHATNAGDKQFVGEYQANDKAITDNSDKIKENTETMKQLSEEVSKIKPKSTESPDMPTVTPGSSDGAGGGSTGGKKVTDKEKEIKEDFKKERDRVEGLIAKVDQWYNLQDATINEFAATGKITDDEAKKALDAMKIARNIALEKARLAVATGDDTDWKKFYEENMSKMMIDHGEWSAELFKQIGDVDVLVLHQFLATIQDPEMMAKLDASSFFDTMRKKAAESRKIISETQAKATEELNKMLLKYEYFDKAARQFASNLIQIGALGTTAEQMARGMEGAPTAEQSIEAVKGLLAAMLRQGTGLYKVNPSDAQGVADMISVTVSQTMNEADYLEGRTSGEQAHWFDLFPALKDWMENPEQHKKELENFYQVMLQAEQDYYTKRKQSYDFEKRQHEERFRAAGYTEQETEEQTAISNVGKMKDAGIGATFAEQQGLGSIANDPEVLAVLNRIKYRQMDIESAESRINALRQQQQQELADLRAKQDEELALRQAAGATIDEMDQLRMEHRQQLADMEAELNMKRMGAEDLLREYQANLFDQETQLATTVAQELRKRVQTINTLTKPIQDGAKNIGQKFGEMIRGMEEQSMTWAEIWHSMAQAVGDSIIDMMAQYAQNMIMEKMMNQQSREDAIKTASVKVPAGIASGAAETVGQLGWWGLALIPVIAAVLHGLLAAAFASNKQNDTSKSSVTKVKLASGMLTYDSGNVSTLASGGSPARNRRKLYDDGTTQVYDRDHSFSAGRGSVTARRPFLGQDGHVYTATPETLPEGVKLVQHPIATTVNSQPALVAERGPEIVIGRRTTKRIQMAAPELLHAIQLIDRGYMPRLRTYDEGNVAAMAQLPAPQQGRGAEGGAGSEDAQMQQTIAALTQTVALLSSTVADLQRKGIPAHINKYGTGGLIDEVKSGLRFDARYNR